ncbi:dihydrofolate reductase family protein [Jeotgalibacillus sp. R-1-5s-1]|uniref:dihydrofolate reductase family protein n=1 Tax=Jeotgalibacillus sp. R-1-5s-1 TaxID=2555897 RepID=UPI001069CDEA|nr:dihydrofolate reductase family protein [Jeotgalibacillus sp. R-1-5s-1]TFE00774.1 dihydrofolate reductase [Jeotgalibacillus sp. R-1-5s-1]
MHKNKLYIAISLDGMIAKEDDSLEWLEAAEGLGDNGYQAFYDSISSVVMGNRTYRKVMEMTDDFPYPDRPSYVLSRTQQEDPNVTFTSGSLKTLLPELQKKHNGDVWIVGGGELVKHCLEHQLIDEFQIAIIPVVLGSGIPLFPKGTAFTELKLTKVEQFNQITMLHYMKK